MATKGLFNYSAADACGESPLNSDPSNLFNEFGFTAVRTSLASYEDKMCLSKRVRLAFLASNQTFSKHTCLGDSPLPSLYSARLLREVRKVSAASSGKQERVKKQQIPQSKTRSSCKIILKPEFPPCNPAAAGRSRAWSRLMFWHTGSCRQMLSCGLPQLELVIASV